MKNGNSNLNVGGLALGFGLGALFVILLMWIGGAMLHGNGMMGQGTMGQGTMGQGTMWTSGGMGSIGATILVVIVAAIIGALVAVAHNTVGRKN